MKSSIFLFALFVLGIDALSLSKSHVNGPAFCAKKCDKHTDQKYQFAASKTYIYQYDGESIVEVEGMADGKKSQKWGMQVLLSWLTPCDAVIEIKNPSVDGKLGNKHLTNYPLVIGMANGVVEEVCAHPDDEASSINIKKGIASLLQNSLLKFSHPKSSVLVHEDDISGRCPTNYTIESYSSESSAVIRKFKDFKTCDGRYVAAPGSPLSAVFLKSPLPIQESYSVCTQKVNKNIPESVTCQEQNIIRPSMINKQISKLELKGEKQSSQTSMPLSEIRRTTLKFDFTIRPIDKEAAPKMKTALKTLCKQIENKIEKESSKTVTELIKLMRKAPSQSIQQIFSEIKSKQLCSSPRLESIFMDVIAHVSHPDTFKIMADYLVKQSGMDIRTLLYVSAFHLQSTPTLETIQNVLPVFKSNSRLPLLAAGALAGKYCDINRRCVNENPIKEIFQVLSQRVSSACSSSGSDKNKKIETLAVLKTIGNIGNMTHSLEDVVLDCMENKQADMTVRVTAAEAFRSATCHDHATERLVRNAVKSTEKTELRIASYLQVMNCARSIDIAHIVGNITHDMNKQVRGFVLSHLSNLQQSTHPHHQKQKYLLSNYFLPQDYEYNLKKYSGSSDFSYFTADSKFGAGLLTNVIYDGESYYPKSISEKLTISIMNMIMDPVDFGAKFNNLEQLISDFKKLLESEQLLSNDSQKPTIDLFVRLFKQEIAFADFSIELQKLQQMHSSGLDLVMFEIIKDVLQAFSNTNKDYARALHLSVNFAIPSQMGIPFEMSMENTIVMKLDVKSNVNLISFLELKPTKGSIELKPTVSVHNKFAVRHHSGMPVGVVSESTLRLQHDFKTDLELTPDHKISTKFFIPNKEEIFDFDTELYFTKGVQGETLVKTYPSSTELGDFQGCSKKPAKFLGVIVCWKVKSPHMIRSIVVKGSGVITIQRSEPSFSYIGLQGKIQKSGSEKTTIELDLIAPACKENCAIVAEIERQETKKSMSVWGQIPTSSGMASRLVKMEWEQVQAAYGRKHHLSAYWGKQRTVSSDDQVMTAVAGYGRRDTLITFDLGFDTKGALAHYANINAAVDADLKLVSISSGIQVPVLNSLRKCEFHIDSTMLKTDLSVKSPDQSSYELTSQMKLRNEQIFSANGLAKVSGSVEQENLAVDLNGKVTTRQSTYKTMARVVSTVQKCEIEVKVEDGQTQIFITSLAMQREQSAYKVTGQMSMPKYIRKHSIDLEAKETSSSEYSISAVVKREGSALYKITGPVQANRDQMKLVCDLKIECEQGAKKIYNLKLSGTNEETKKSLSVSVSCDSKKYVDYILNYSSGSSSTLISKLRVPNVVDGSINIKRSSPEVTVSLMMKVRPQAAGERTISADIDLNTAAKSLKTKMFTQLSNNQASRMGLDLSFNKVQTGDYKVDGSVELHGKSNKVSAEILMRLPRVGQQGGYGVSILVVTPEQKHFDFTFKVMVHVPTENECEVVPEFKFQLPSGKSLMISSKASLKKESGPYSFSCGMKMSAESSAFQKVQLNIKSSSLNTQSSVAPKIMVQVSGPAVNGPIKIMLESQLSKSSAQINFQTTKQSQKIISLTSNSKYQIESGMISDIDCSVDLEVPTTELKSIKANLMKASSGQVSLKITKQGQNIVTLDGNLPSSGSERKITAIISATSQKSEVSVYQSGSELTMKVTPNKSSAKSAYVIKASIQSGNAKGIDIVVKTPNSKKNIKIAAGFEKSESQIKAHAIVDLFTSPQKAIDLRVVAQATSSGVYNAELNIKAASYSLNPKMIVEFTNKSPSSKHMAIIYHSKSSSSPMISVSMDCTRVSTTFAVSMKSSGKYAELIGAVNRLNSPRCQGRAISASLSTHSYGNYHVSSKACSPVYIEVEVKPENSANKYSAEMGLKNYRELVMGVYTIKQKYEAMPESSEVYAKEKMVIEQEIQPVASAYAKLISSLLMKVHASYNLERLESIKNSFEQSQLKSDCRHVFNLAKQEVETIMALYSWDDIISDIKELFSNIWNAIKHFWHEITKILLPYWEDITQWFKNIWHDITNVVQKIIDYIKRHLFPSLQSIRINWIDFINGLKERYEGEWEIIASWWNSLWNAVPSPEQLREQCEWALESMKEMSLVKYCTEEYNELENKYPSLKVSVEYIWRQMKMEAKRVSVWARQYQPVRIMAKMLRQETQEVAWKELTTKIVESVGISFGERRGYLNIFFPTKYRVGSVFTSTINIGFPRLYNQTYRQYGQIASITGSSIQTFNGAVIKMEPSSCEYNLASSPDTEVQLTRQGTKNDRISIVTDGKTVIITPSQDIVTLNGHQYKAPTRQTIGRITLILQNDDITVITPSLAITCNARQNYVIIHAHASANGKVHGLVGSNDDNISTDVQTRKGSKSTSTCRCKQQGECCSMPEASRRLTNSYKVKKTCRPVARNSVTMSHPDEPKCVQWINKLLPQSSPLKKPFYALCKHEDPCSVAKSFSQQLKKHHIPSPKLEC